jgi:N-acetylneuraminic acid mutarotase
MKRIQAISALLLITLPNLIFSQNYSWEKGFNNNTGAGVYSFYDSAFVTNNPLGRAEAAHWTDAKGRFWIFGGDRTSFSSSPNYMSDMLLFNPDTRIWILKKGNYLTYNNLGLYGQQGVENANNLPGARRNAATWTDALGNLWLFGGTGYSETNGANMLNDLWRYNTVTNNWTWMKGSKQLMQSGDWGTQGNPNSQNIPGARQGCVTWIDNNGDLWLFGGYGFNVVGNLTQLADLWRYNVATNMWTWISGSNNTPFGVYTSIGSTGKPGGRTDAGCWKDKQGNFWLYGGFGNTDAFGVGYNYLNDIWKYDPISDIWTWMKGSLYTDIPATRGTKGVSNINNTPGGRRGFGFTSDPAGNFWILGGRQTDGNALTEEFGDLWKYEPANNRWTWMNGSSQPSDFSVYGTINVPSPANTPGARINSCGWTDRFGHLWFLGGYGRALTVYSGFMNDLWRYGNCVNGAFNIEATTENICEGETISLNIVPTQTVNWSTSQINSSITVSPSATTTYSATITDNYGCSLQITKQIEVSICQNLSEKIVLKNKVTIYPNPGNGTFYLKQLPIGKHELKIYDISGRCVIQQVIDCENNKFNANLEPGIYTLIIDQSTNYMKFLVD